MSKYDVCIIGAGPGGYKAALILAKNGKKVCLVEKKSNHIGGTCLNEGCIPAKNFLESSNYVKKFSYFKNQGVQGELDGFDMALLKNRTKELLSVLRGGIENKLKTFGVDVRYEEAKFEKGGKVFLSESKEYIEAKKYIIATGSVHREHPVLSIDKRDIISSDEVFELEEIPKSLLIVGAGAIGCEFADFFNALGSKVHLCEFTPSILPLEDKDVSSTIQREFKKRGIKIDVSTSVKSYEKIEGKLVVKFEKQTREFEGEFDKILVSIGRVPNTKSLSLDSVRVKHDSRGFIEVDKRQLTSNEDIYAIGDVTPSPSLAHVAYHEAKKAAYDILGFDQLNESVVPNVVFTSPQVGSVGKSESYLKEKGSEYEVKKLFLKTLGMPKIKGDDSGFIKLLIDKNSKRLLGCSMVGYDMTEIINQVAICLNTKLTIKDINSMIFAHPTMSESFYKTLES